MEFYLYKDLRIATSGEGYQMQTHRPKGWSNMSAAGGETVAGILGMFVSHHMWQMPTAPESATVEQIAELLLCFEENATEVIDEARGLLCEADMATRATKVTGDMFDSMFEED